MTLAMSGTGMAGMETCIANLIEPGDAMLVCVNGAFGGRMADIAGRYGAEVNKLAIDWGRVFDPDQIRTALKKKGARIVGIVHAETSTGAHQPIEEISKIVHEHGALLIVDTVTSLAGTEGAVDSWEHRCLLLGNPEMPVMPAGPGTGYPQ